MLRQRRRDKSNANARKSERVCSATGAAAQGARPPYICFYANAKIANRQTNANL